MFKKILVGLDVDVEARHAFDDALSISKATNAFLTLLHVFSLDEVYNVCQLLLYDALEHPTTSPLEQERPTSVETLSLQAKILILLLSQEYISTSKMIDTNGESLTSVETLSLQAKILILLLSQEYISTNKMTLSKDPLWQYITSKSIGHEADQPEILLACLDEAKKAGVQANILPRRGQPGRVLCDVARNEQADLIAVGHRDKQWGQELGMGELRLGSSSHYVIHYAPCSVLIAHRHIEDDVAIGALAGMSQILMAVDDSAMSQIVFQEALDLARKVDADLTLLSIASPSENNHPSKILQSLKDQASAVGVPVTIEQHRAKTNQSIGQAICEFANKQQFDLILVGRRRFSEVQEQILGSVSHYVAYHAPCAVILVQHSQSL